MDIPERILKTLRLSSSDRDEGCEYKAEEFRKDDEDEEDSIRFFEEITLDEDLPF